MIKQLGVYQDQLLLGELRQKELAGVDPRAVPGPASLFAALRVPRQGGHSVLHVSGEGGGPALLHVIVSDSLETLIHVTEASIFLGD